MLNDAIDKMIDDTVDGVRISPNDGAESDDHNSTNGSHLPVRIRTGDV